MQQIIVPFKDWRADNTAAMETHTHQVHHKTVSLYHTHTRAPNVPLTRCPHLCTSLPCIQLWKQSGFDVAVAEQLLSQQLGRRTARAQAAAQEAGRLVAGAGGLRELQLVVDELAGHMDETGLARAVGRVTSLLQVGGADVAMM